MAGLTLVEVLVGVVVIAMAAVGSTQAMLMLNRHAMTSRVVTNARVLVQEEINRTLTAPFAPSANPPVIADILNIGETTSAVVITRDSEGEKMIEGQLTRAVEELENPLDVTMRIITVSLDYTYLGRSRNVTMTTIRAPDIR